jgi:hypothetical protein
MTKKCESSIYYISNFNPFKKKKPCNVPDDMPEAKYCKGHGCRVCKLVNPKNGFRNKLGEEFCSDVCKINDALEVIADEDKRKAREKEIEEEREWKEGIIEEVEETCDNLKRKFQEDYISLYKKIEKIDLGKFKGAFIRGEKELEEFLDYWHGVIESSSLERVEKDQWKKIYSKGNCVGNLTILIREEPSFLLSLAKKIKLQEKEAKREKESLIREIKTELNCFEPRVELEDLPSDYHNYESWENEELKEKKNQIIEEIRNKREEKKLSALLVKADACINDEIELKEFIRKLEKFTLEGASEYKKNAYKSQENKVDEVIGNLWDRLENLEEEVNLNFRKDEACRNFDEWLKEGEDLVLPNDCPCRELKEDIKSFTDKDLILSKQKQAFQSVVEEFKNNVKNQLSAEKFDGEYQVIDKAKDFNGVKLMREVVRVNRLVLEKKKDSEEKSWDIIEGEIDKLKSLLDSKSEINLSEVNELVEKLKEEISNARSVKNQKQEENRPNSSSPFLWLGIITMLVVSFSAILIVWIKKRKHFCSKN